VPIYIVYEEAQIVRTTRYRIEARCPQEAIDKAGEMDESDAIAEPREKCYDYTYSAQAEE
jgi:hypothetical protein